jgi:hypothetical protein
MLRGESGTAADAGSDCGLVHVPPIDTAHGRTRCAACRPVNRTATFHGPGGRPSGGSEEAALKPLRAADEIGGKHAAITLSPLPNRHGDDSISVLAQALATRSEQAPTSDVSLIGLFCWAGLLVTLALIYMRADAVKSDLEALAKLRHHLIFEQKIQVPIDALKDAIDDYAEKLTGDRRALHVPNHSIGR